MTKITKPSNSITVTGVLAEHNLTQRVAENGREFINGNIIVDTSTEEGQTNEVKISVLQFADKKNPKNKEEFIKDNRYDSVVSLMDMIGSPVRISASYNNSVFVNENDETVKGANISAGFYSTSNVGKTKAEFKVTALIKSIAPEVIGEVETGNVVVSTDVFNYNGSNFIPKKFIVSKDNKGAVDYFLNSGAIGEGDVTDLWGNIVSTSSKKVVQSAFGEDKIEEGAAYIVGEITGARREVYDMSEELETQVKEAKQAYRVYVATQEERSREYKAKRENESGASTDKATKSEPNKGSFEF